MTSVNLQILKEHISYSLQNKFHYFFFYCAETFIFSFFTFPLTSFKLNFTSTIDFFSLSLFLFSTFFFYNIYSFFLFPKIIPLFLLLLLSLL